MIDEIDPFAIVAVAIAVAVVPIPANGVPPILIAVSYTHLTLPTKRIV